MEKTDTVNRELQIKSADLPIGSENRKGGIFI
jgi:hypothetical protein